ncbi:MAG: signal peptidase I [Clostridiales bacterium]|nr:signal peptidase I [Clostridiales bacterium]
MRESPKEPRVPARIKKELREWAMALAIAVVAALIIRTFLYTVISVDGPSMQDTLYTGDRLIVTIADMKLTGPQRFDVVICHFPRSEWTKQYVKRVIGLPGETIEVRDGVTLINGQPIDEPFLSPDKVTRYKRANFGPVEIPEGNYFVMGDHRDDSNDSRSVGTITTNEMIGIARVRMWPPDRLGLVAGSGTYQ